MSEPKISLTELIRDALDLPDSILTKLEKAGRVTVIDVQVMLQVYAVLHRSPEPTLSESELELIKKALNTKEPESPSKEKVVSIATPEQKQLNTLEARYRQELKEVNLIGELAIDEEDCKKIGSYFGEILDKHKSTYALGLITEKYPATLLVFLTGVGIYHYDEAGYWPAVSEFLGGPHYHRLQNTLKTEYQNLLPVFDLPDFLEEREEYKGKTFYYVRLILLHGGIPKASLDSFFSDVVRPICENPDLEDLPIDEQLDDIRQFSRFYQSTDKPVVQFLDYGGNVAKDFLERSIALYQTYKDDQEILDAEQAGLPPYVIKFFSKWVEERERKSVDLHRKANRAKIKFEPWGVGIFLSLPPQQSSIISDYQEKNLWELEIDADIQEIDAAVSDYGELTETRSLQVLIRKPFEKICAHFLAIQEQKKTCFKPNPDGLYLFSPQSGNLEKRIKATRVWIVYPDSYSLDVVSGTGNRYEVLPDLGGEWRSYRIEAWDFTLARQITIKNNGQLVRTLSLSAQDEKNKPSLEAGNEFSQDLNENPVFIGHPPKIIIPIQNMDELRRWKIDVKSLENAVPKINKLLPISELSPDAIQIIDNTIEIVLDDESLLGRRPFGKFRAHAKGPLGKSALFRFSILPELHMLGNEKIFLPVNHKIKSMNLICDVGVTAGIKALDNFSEISRDERNRFHLKVNPALPQTPIRIFRDFQNAQSAFIDVRVKVNSLRWKIVSDWNVAEEWYVTPLLISQDAFLQKEGAFAVVHLPKDQQTAGDLVLALTDSRGNDLQRSKQQYDVAKIDSELYRFTFDQFTSTIAQSSSSIHSFVIRLVDPETEESIWTQPITSVRQRLDVSNLRIIVDEKEGNYDLSCQWEEIIALKFRTFVLWPEWRYWDPPTLIEIPDEAENQFSTTLNIQQIVPGEYLVQMVVFDPWIDDESTLKKPSTEEEILECEEIVFSNPVIRARDLYSQISTEENFDTRLELLIISQLLRDSQTSEKQFLWCCRNLDKATGRQFMAFREFALNAESLELESQFIKASTTPDFIEHLLNEYRKKRLPVEDISSVVRPLIQSDTFTKEGMLLLLGSSIPELELLVLKKLLALDLVTVFDTLISFYKNGKLSWINMLELLLPHRDSVFQKLRATIEKDDVEERLYRFFDQKEDVYEVGDWLIAGTNFGFIETAYNVHTQLNSKKFVISDTDIRLKVQLHLETGYPEETVFSPATGELTFTGRKHKITYQCQNCHYITQSSFASKRHYMETYHEIISTGEKNFILDAYKIEKKTDNI
jgi:hypothetical protein